MFVLHRTFLKTINSSNNFCHDSRLSHLKQSVSLRFHTGQIQAFPFLHLQNASLQQCRLKDCQFNCCQHLWRPPQATQSLLQLSINFHQPLLYFEVLWCTFSQGYLASFLWFHWNLRKRSDFHQGWTHWYRFLQNLASLKRKCGQALHSIKPSRGKVFYPIW